MPARTAYQGHLHEDRQSVPKRQQKSVDRHCITPQKSEDLIYNVVKTLNLARVEITGSLQVGNIIFFIIILNRAIFIYYTLMYQQNCT
jgi:hypothetical protein